MTNGSIMSRRGCVERIEILEDGTIPPVEMTSLGFEESLNPYKQTDADTVCVLKEGRQQTLLTELDAFTRVITNITDGCIMGWKYFDFGDDFTNDELTFMCKVLPRGCHGTLHICIDNEKNEIGVVEFERDSTILKTKVKHVTGRHAVYLIAKSHYKGWSACYFENRQLFDLMAFQFCK